MFHRFRSRPAIFALLLTALVFTGCPMSPGPDPWTAEQEWIYENLHGTWSAANLGGDSWVIDAADNNFQTLAYDMGSGIAFEGRILEVQLFDDDGSVGVILIRYRERPTDWEQSEPVAGDYIGVFFSNLTATTGQFAAPVDENWLTPAQTSLAAARRAFTVDTMGDYVGVWATYVRQ